MVNGLSFRTTKFIDSRMPILVSTYFQIASQQINGLRLLNDYIDGRYEKELISNIDRSSWSGELKRRVQHYGYKYDYKTRRITSNAYQGPLLNWLYVLGQQLESEKLIPFLPDQAIINEYLPGQGGVVWYWRQGFLIKSGK